MSLNTIRALLILNTKKGWSDAARKKAALTRKAKKKPEVLLSKVTGKKTLTQRRNEIKAKHKKALGKIPKKPGTPFETTVKGGLKTDKPIKVKLVEVTGAARLNRGKKRYVLGYGGQIRPFNGAFSLQKGDRVFHESK